MLLSMHEEVNKKDNEVIESSTEIMSVEWNTLKNIQEITIDSALPKEEKIKNFIEQIGNPYLFRVGEVVVKTSFHENTNTLQEILQGYFDTSIF